MWWHRENLVAQRVCDGSSGNVVAEWLRWDVVAYQGMWWHRENMVAQRGCGGIVAQMGCGGSSGNVMV